MSHHISFDTSVWYKPWFWLEDPTDPIGKTTALNSNRHKQTISDNQPCQHKTPTSSNLSVSSCKPRSSSSQFFLLMNRTENSEPQNEWNAYPSQKRRLQKNQRQPTDWGKFQQKNRRRWSFIRTQHVFNLRPDPFQTVYVRMVLWQTSPSSVFKSRHSQSCRNLQRNVQEQQLKLWMSI